MLGYPGDRNNPQICIPRPIEGTYLMPIQKRNSKHPFALAQAIKKYW